MLLILVYSTFREHRNLHDVLVTWICMKNKFKEDETDIKMNESVEHKDNEKKKETIEIFSFSKGTRNA